MYLSCVEHLHDSIISLWWWEVLTNRTSSSPPLANEQPITRRSNDRSCICPLGLSTSLSMIYRLGLRTDPTGEVVLFCLCVTAMTTAKNKTREKRIIVFNQNDDKLKYLDTETIIISRKTLLFQYHLTMLTQYWKQHLYITAGWRILFWRMHSIFALITGYSRQFPWLKHT